MTRTAIFTICILMLAALPCSARGSQEPMAASSSLTATEREQGFKELAEEIPSTHPYLNGISVYHQGKPVFNAFYNNYSRSDLQLCASVTKSFTSLLAGIAIDKGYIDNAHQSVFDFFKEHPVVVNYSGELPELSIHNLLTMTSGIPYNVVSDMGRWIRWQNPLTSILEEAVATQAHSTFRYNDPGCHLLIYIIEEASGMPIKDFAMQYLFEPLDISTYRWESDADGRYYGSHGLWLTTDDLAKLGLLMLSGGRYEDRQIVNNTWIDAMKTAYLQGGMPYYESYGYLLFVTKITGMEAYFGAGYGGQFVVVIPELEMVAAIHCDIATHRDREVRNLVPNKILPLIK